ncbi:MAG TPA: hypothetical protein VF077_07360 [Nitrospiraceae bacterium]
MNRIYLDPAAVPQHLRGGYAGKKFKAIVGVDVIIPAQAGIWDGGSRDTYRLIHLATGNTVNASDQFSHPGDSSRKNQHIKLEPGFAVVQHTTFRGDDFGLTFHIHPDNAAALLPPPAADMPLAEKLVLAATASFKSSYGGRDRYDMARDSYAPCWADNNGKPAFPSRDEWQAAKLALAAKGLLNKAGAITPAGRNAVDRTILR